MRHLARALFLSTALVCLPNAAALHAQRTAPVANGTAPTVSPDGQFIAFFSAREGSQALYVMKVDGSDVRRISPNGEAVQGRPYFLRDSRHVFASRRVGDTTLVVSFPIEGGTSSVVARIVEFTGGAVPFPGGDRYVYGVGGWTETQLESARLDGSERRRLTDARAAHWCPSVSPSGDRVAVGRRDSTTWQVWVVNADGTGGHAVARFPVAEGSAECPKWSSDGKRIAFQSGSRFAADTTRRTSNIWVVDATGNGLVKLAPHASPWLDETPTWFPDGKRIAFQSDRTGAWEVWIMNADGTDQRQVSGRRAP